MLKGHARKAISSFLFALNEHFQETHPAKKITSYLYFSEGGEIKQTDGNAAFRLLGLLLEMTYI